MPKPANPKPKQRALALTEALVAPTRREIPDPGPEAGRVYHSESDYDSVVAGLLSGTPADGEVWLFAYGSLIWKPECDVEESYPALLRGWRRKFCLYLTRWRGTRDNPGIMLALDRGGSCNGVVYRLPKARQAECLGALVRREMSVKPPNNMPVWVSAEAASGRVKAIAFVSNRAGIAYRGDLAEAEIVRLICAGCGHLGSCAEYLRNTVQHLEEMGIADSYLWRLQALVAKRLESRARRL